MKEEVFKTQEDFAKFINLKAKEGFTEIHVAVGTVTVPVEAKNLLAAVPKDKEFTVVYATGPKNYLGIGDIL